MKRRVLLATLAAAALALACSRGGSESAPSGEAPPPAPSAFPAAKPAPPDLPRGLLVALSQFEVSPDGKVLPKPKAARVDVVTRQGGKWQVQTIEDPESNVFHKAMVFDGGDGPGILTLGGSAAILKLWRKGPNGFTAEKIWEKDFGGRFSRMRDAEAADLYGDGHDDLAVATHDQGVVAIVRRRPDGTWEAKEIDHQKDTFVHEIEIGDLDGDGVLEVYATLSQPNRLDGSPQSGVVTRYVPKKNEGRVVVADLGDRHAKEILVGDVDGDGRDELYVSVEAKTEGTGDQLRVVEPVEIRRYDAGTDPKKGVVIARLPDRFCRVLTAGDIDGDGKKEIVAAAFKSGLWLLRPGSDPHAPWEVTSIDKDSSGFEHAALLADLDGDGKDELYVASDDQGELRRYVWQDGGWAREVILPRTPIGSIITWNLMPVPVSMVK
jgi:hypothetical protein